MPAAKIAIAIDRGMLRSVDQLVHARRYPSRSRIIQQAVAEKIARIEKTRLARECAKLSIQEEQEMADEGLSMEVDQWPKY